MKKFHVALSTDDLESSVSEYTRRLGAEPCVVIRDQYALWRTESVNLSVRLDPAGKPGTLRHLGWEDSEAAEFQTDNDCNGVLWENFSATQQAEEIEAIWPGTGYSPERGETS